MVFRNRHRLISGAVLVISLTLTWALWTHERMNAQRDLKANLDVSLREVTSRIEQHMTAYEQVMRGVMGFFAGSDRQSRAAFRTYVNSVQLGVDFFGIQGLGLTSIVLPSELPAHTQALRTSGLVNYKVYPPGLRDQYAPIIQIEPPSARNSAQLGFDPMADPVRRSAMERAAVSGSASTSQKVTPMDQSQGSDKPECVMYLPLYRDGVAPDSPTKRRDATLGWVFAQLRISDLMASLYGERRSEVAIFLHESVDRNPQSLLYASVKESEPNQALESSEYLSIGGVTWVLTVRAGPNFAEVAGHDQSKVILISGLLLSGLLTLFCWQLLVAKDVAVALARDMTKELRKSEELARDLAQHDALTALPNRSLFSDRVNHALSLARRNKTRLALLYIDLDHFKSINDEFGHAVGDTVLLAAAARLEAAVRESDTVGRMGGDEFVVLLAPLPSNDVAQSVAEKMLDCIRQPLALPGPQLHFSASIGIATFPEDGDDEVSLSRAADRAMYRAKANDRNCIEWAASPA